MSNLQGNGPTNDLKTRRFPAGRFSGSWIAAAVVAVIVVLGLAYTYGDRWMNSSDTVEHRAVTEDHAPVASPISPAPNAAPLAPAATPKP
jgi:hypothetical protein